MQSWRTLFDGIRRGIGLMMKALTNGDKEKVSIFLSNLANILGKNSFLFILNNRNVNHSILKKQ